MKSQRSEKPRADSATAKDAARSQLESLIARLLAQKHRQLASSQGAKATKSKRQRKAISQGS
jgi:hypothetical protein